MIVASGAVRVDGQPVPTDSIAYLPVGRDEVAFEADDDARLLLLGGQPLGETVAMWWNFVARTHDEIVEAAAAWNAGSDRFGQSVASHLARIPAPATPWGRERA